MTQSYSIAVSPLDDSSSIRKKLAAVPIVPNSILGGTLTRQPAYLAPTDLSSVSYSVERLGLAPGRLALLVAEGFTGKTALAQYFGICIAHGKAIFGQFPVTAGKVLHIDQEQDEQQTFDRNHLLAAGLGIAETPQLFRRRLDVKLDDPSLDRTAVKAELVVLCKGYAFVIVDSLKKITCAEENNAEVSEVVHLLKEVAEQANTCIMLVHHKGKTKSDARQSGRGHSSIYDSVDCQWDLANVGDGSCELKNTKNRSRMSRLKDGLIYTIRNPGEFLPEKDCTSGGTTFELVSDAIKPDHQTDEKLKRDILQLVQKNPRINTSAIKHQIAGDNNKISSVLKELVQDNLITSEAGKGTSRHHVITDDGVAVLAYEVL